MEGLTRTAGTRYASADERLTMPDTSTELANEYVDEIRALVQRAERGESIRTPELYRGLSYLLDIFPEYEHFRTIFLRLKRDA